MLSLRLLTRSLGPQINHEISHNLLAGNRSSLQTALRCLSSQSPASDSDFKVYYGILSPQIRAVKVFSLATSIGGVIAQPILLEQASKIGGTPMIVAICGIAGFFTFVTPLLLHLITKRYVTELYYDVTTKEYTASTITFFLMKQQTKFKLEDVVVPEIPGMFTTFMVGKKSLFVDPKLFPDPTHYIKIMGYDKPIDFKFEEARQSAAQEDDKK
ncbi:transmembrane protein 70 homolog, mitochondrial [Culex pipiens pallens]|uniref:Transmembrane protein 70 homolog, mitochondrial n=1 Tax=Culex pipiens TaxID=7175 RepID=A0A8D8GKZ0_CULPI|nr:transmembrane protein 70 homolog, mitochondrial [Culex pipiens pallens]